MTLTTDRSGLFQRVRFGGNPVANPDSVVLWGNKRFTILTPCLLRLEWSETGNFEDRGTYAFPTRHAPAPPFTTRGDDNRLTLNTRHLTVRCVRDDGHFTAENLAISLRLGGELKTWVPGMPDTGNLQGTRRTLDRCGGDAALDPGLLSRDGWSLFDDSRSILFDPESGWPVPRPGHALQDWYFFGYGHEYRTALTEYTRFGGAVPLIPRFALGSWWSRYWAYSDNDLKQLVQDFERHDLPLDVLVVDMDWHTPHAWTGYTWNRELFPDPPAFLRWAHEKQLRVTLNLHPAQGVAPFEEVYARFAQTMGQDPGAGERIPFQITDRRFVQSYFELLHHPMEDEGVDFWWLDWQQGEATEMPGLDPLPWLNHLHHADSRRRGLRPMLYSRWGGLGNHRYPIGFSGDTWVTWEALQFQPFFTATAANVLYGWWSHDIGGHMGGPTEPELFARWLQFGAVNPILRLHATKDPRAERRPWKYPEPVFQAARSAFKLRYQLIPYMYTLARVASDTGIAPCRPMYYDYPDQDAAYVARFQYLLGDQMIVAPIVRPARGETGLASTDVWIPDGTWIDLQTKESLSGPRWARLFGGLERLPILMKAGAILPLAAPFDDGSSGMTSGSTDALPNDRLILTVLPGDQSTFRLYEDDGITEAYKRGQCEWTEITNRAAEPSRWEVQIDATEGYCSCLPSQRGYQLRLEGSQRPRCVTIDGRETLDWVFVPNTLTTVIEVPPRDKKQPTSIIALADGLISALGQEHNSRLVEHDVQRLLGAHPPGEQDLQGLISASRTAGDRTHADVVARLGGPFIHYVEFATPSEASQCLGLIIVSGPRDRSEPYDIAATFTKHGGGASTQKDVRLDCVLGDQMIGVPFAFDGRLGTFKWEVDVELVWRGETLRSHHCSRTYFPSIYAWSVLVRDEQSEPRPSIPTTDRDGKPDARLAWKPRVQDVGLMANLQEPHVLRFTDEHVSALRAGVPLVAYLSTRILCPQTRRAVMRFRAPGEAEVFLNGQPVDLQPAVSQDEAIHPFFRDARRTTPMALTTGANHLLVWTRPPREGDRYWFFEGAMTTPDGFALVDLSYDLSEE